MEYGMKRPNVHTMPNVYYSRTTGFTEVTRLFIQYVYTNVSCAKLKFFCFLAFRKMWNV